MKENCIKKVVMLEVAYAILGKNGEIIGTPNMSLLIFKHQAAAQKACFLFSGETIRKVSIVAA